MQYCVCHRSWVLEGVQCRQLALKGLRIQLSGFVQAASCLGSIRKVCEVHRPIMKGARLIHVVATLATGCPNSTTIA